jgi:hypothetical protein
MLGVAVVLFALAALFGITLAVQHLKKKMHQFRWLWCMAWQRPWGWCC